MQRNFYLFFISIICLFIFGSQANAFVCVSNSAEFIAALTSPPPDNDIRLIGGTTATPAVFTIPAGSDTHFNVNVDHSLEISGGWNAPCSDDPLPVNPDLTVLAGNETQDNSGGVLSVTINNNLLISEVWIHNLTISNGSSLESGGGLFFLHTGNSALTVKVKLYDIIVEDNETGAFGAGIEVLDNGSLRGMSVYISDCIVRGNFVTSSLTDGPGGISVEVPFTVGAKKADTTISNCQILNNSAGVLGGGLYVDSGTGYTTLTNNVIARNSISNDNGGGVYITNSEGGYITLTNNTITENEATGDGGGLYVDLDNTLSRLNIYNNIIFNNAASGDGDDIFITGLARPDPNAITINNNDYNNAPSAGYLIDGIVQIPPLLEI